MTQRILAVAAIALIAATGPSLAANQKSNSKNTHGHSSGTSSTNHGHNSSRKSASTSKSKTAKTATASQTNSSTATTKSSSDAGTIGPKLQLGLYSSLGEAEWAWQSFAGKNPDLARQLSQSIEPDAGGAVLRATVTRAGVDGNAFCREVLRHGQGCFIVRAAAATPQVAMAAIPGAPTAQREDASTVIPLPAVKPDYDRGAETAAATARATPVATATVTTPAPAAPTAAAPAVLPSLATAEPPSNSAGRTLSTVTLPPQATPGGAAPADAPAATAGDAVATPGVKPAQTVLAHTLDGFFQYSPDDAKVLAEIERRTVRRGRVGAVLPGGGLDVTPAVLTLPEYNICALTFDDGPHRTITRKVLEILTAEKVVATYFPIGNVAIRYPDIIRDWVAAGHEIGNHSYTHHDMKALKPDQQRFEVAETNKVLRALGATSTLFRPPYGRYNADLEKVVHNEGSQMVLWNVDTRDWKDRNARKVVEHVVTAAGAGSVLLLHSTYASTAEALPMVIKVLRQRRCEFVTMSEWISKMRAAGDKPLTNAALPSPAPADGRARN